MEAEDIVSDSRLAGFLKRQITINQPSNPKLANLKFCGSQIVKQQGAFPAVFLLSDGEKSRLFGNTSCRSAWACPKCMPIVMAKKGTDIACAIDALAKWYDEYAFMITFTLPHSKYMSCTDALTVLQWTWRDFTKNKRRAKLRNYTLKLSVGEENHKGGNAVGKAGEVRQYFVKADAWGGFREDLQIQHSVRVYEFTWSEKNGWHPHIHALFWTKKKNFAKILNYEDELLERWWKCAKRAALKYWNVKFPDKKEENKKAVEDYYTDWRMKSKDGHKSLFISRDKETGKAEIKKSSYYIAGWSGDAECTASNFKTAANGHFTPYQMLKRAYEDARLVEKFIPLYLEYCNTVFARRRVEYSKTGITKIIRQWKKTEEFKTAFKKKCIEKLDASRKFKVVYWFSELQWREIYYLDLSTDEEIIPQLLVLAKQKDCRAKIDKLLESYNIPITKYEHHLIDHIEQKIFENRISA